MRFRYEPMEGGILRISFNFVFFFCSAKNVFSSVTKYIYTDIAAKISISLLRNLVFFWNFKWIFSFVAAILVLYLTRKLSYSNDEATVLFHTFTSLAYLFPLIGAIIADSWLGRFKWVRVYIFSPTIFFVIRFTNLINATPFSIHVSQHGFHCSQFALFIFGSFIISISQFHTLNKITPYLLLFTHTQLPCYINVITNTIYEPFVLYSPLSVFYSIPEQFFTCHSSIRLEALSSPWAQYQHCIYRRVVRPWLDCYWLQSAPAA